jgi:hypothetical protein
VTPDRYSAIAGELSELGRRVMRAAVLSGMTTTRECSREALANQLAEEDEPKLLDALKFLARRDPPVVVRGPGQGYVFTYDGALVGRAVVAEITRPTPEVTAPPGRVRSQATLDAEMFEYADEVRATVWQGDGGNCSFCNHHQSYGLKKGGRRLCQICFGRRGLRFESPA